MVSIFCVGLVGVFMAAGVFLLADRVFFLAAGVGKAGEVFFGDGVGMCGDLVVFFLVCLDIGGWSISSAWFGNLVTAFPRAGLLPIWCWSLLFFCVNVEDCLKSEICIEK